MKIKYDKQPFVQVKGFGQEHAREGYEDIIKKLKEKLLDINNKQKVLLIDMYPGVRVSEVKGNLIDDLNPSITYYTDDLIFEDNETVNNKIKDMITDDRVFGKM